MSSLRSRLWTNAIACAADVSLISMTPMSAGLNPLRRSFSFVIAAMGAVASSSAATPRAVCAMRRSARGLPSVPHRRSDTTTAIAAPSCMALVLPGVSVPSGAR